MVSAVSFAMSCAMAGLFPSDCRSVQTYPETGGGLSAERQRIEGSESSTGRCSMFWTGYLPISTTFHHVLFIRCTFMVEIVYFLFCSSNIHFPKPVLFSGPTETRFHPLNPFIFLRSFIPNDLYIFPTHLGR